MVWLARARFARFARFAKPSSRARDIAQGKSVFYGLRKRSIAWPMSASALTTVREAAEAMLTDCSPMNRTGRTRSVSSG
jgi:hypothetical protein